MIPLFFVFDIHVQGKMLILRILCIIIIVHFAESVIVCPTFKDYFTYRTNTNCYENPDGNSDKPIEIMRRWGFHSREYNVTTADGYIISLERLQRKIRKKTPIIIGPGVYMNSLAFIDRGNKSLAFFLADQGYDVWIINWRGTRFSRSHRYLTTNDREYWNMGFHKMAIYDLKSALDFIHAETGRKGIYIGFSMGTTIGLIYNIKEQRSAEKTLSHIVHLAPIATMVNLKSILKYLNPLWPFIRPFVLKIWNGEVIPYKKMKRNILCGPYPFQMVLCEALNKPVLGTSLSKMDPLTYPVTLLQNRESFSIGTIDHYSQIIKNKKFEEYNYGLFGNLIRYGQKKPPRYNLKRLTLPQTMFVGSEDIMATEKDSRFLYDNLPEKSKCGFNVLKGYNHRDIMNGKNVIEDLFYKLLNTLQHFESGKCRKNVD